MLIRAYVFCIAIFIVSAVNGEYLITSPRVWVSEQDAQVCINLLTPSSAGDLVSVETGLIPKYYEEDRTIKPFMKEDVNINLPNGGLQCTSIVVPKVNSTYDMNFKFYGTLNGKEFFHAVNGSITGKQSSRKTFIQTDKYLYKPGQKVQFRVLTVNTPFLKVSTDPYEVIYIKSPSGTRIGQWRDVDNSKGLVHQEFQLAEEPHYGMYQIVVENSKRSSTVRSFVVEEYVLPRFEVKVTTPSYITKAEEEFNITTCAYYTYGEPVKGKVNMTVRNSGWGSCRTHQNIIEPINGCRNISFHGEKLYFRVPSCYSYSINIDAKVIEDGTDVEISASRQYVNVNSEVLSFESLENLEPVKHMIPYEAKVKSSYPDSTPASNEPFTVCWGLWNRSNNCKNITSDAKGIISFILPTFEPYEVKSLKHGEVLDPIINDVVLRESNFYQSSRKRYYSPTNSSLLIKDKPTINCLKDGSSDITLDVIFVANNMDKAEVFVQIISRGQIQYSSSEQVTLTPGSLVINEELLVEPFAELPQNFTRGMFSLPIKVTKNASPEPKVIVWYVRDDGEVVMDSLELSIEKCLNYDVDMKWLSTKVAPGEQSTLKITAEPSSLCSIGIVDKSIELLSNQDSYLRVEDIFNSLRTYDISSWHHSQVNDYDYCRRIFEKEANNTKNEEENKETLNTQRKRSFIVPRPHGGSFSTKEDDAFTEFQNAGLFTFTDLKLENRPCYENPIVYEMYNIAASPQHEGAPAPSFGAAGGSGLADDSTKSKFSPDSAEKTRTYFPETWLWDLEVVGDDGSWENSYNLPDTITEWVGRAVCVNQDEGVGLSKTASITTFTPFFIDLTMPSIVTRSEIIPIKISVFNYLDTQLPIQMSVLESDEYDIILDNSTEVSSKAPVYGSCIGSKEKHVFVVRLRPKSLGDVNITVSAEVVDSLPNCPNSEAIIKKDAIIKPLNVEPEGFPRERTWSKFMCSRDPIKEQTWSLNIPSVTVEGSDRAWLNVAGDMMAPTLENLGRLIRMPYGCGEQNMINFSPNVFILRYLRHTSQTTPQVVYRLKRYLRSGYQRQLRYRHRNGAYSVFGPIDRIGSTWLTSFVVKSFAQARNETFVDESSLQNSVNWLLQQQNDDGCFAPVGKVLHKGMQGGISGQSNKLHTSYVIVSLLETELDVNKTSISNAVNCLLEEQTENPYNLALKAYALALANVPDANLILEDMIINSEKTEDTMMWKMKGLSDKSDAVEVELAGYVVLAMMKVNPIKYQDPAWKVIRWISTKRNAQGGFISTQDTVVALQALATFEMNQPKKPLDITLGIKSNALDTTVNVNENNKLLQQRVMMPKLPTNVTQNISGSGCSLVQAVLRYNAPDPDPSKYFTVSVKTGTSLDRTCKMKTIKVCASYNNADDPESNMALIEVQLVSGYSPVKKDLKDLVPSRFKRYEVNGRTVTFYANSFTASKTCATFRVRRDTDVENAQPGIVKVYDYYEPDQHVSTNYELASFEHCKFEQEVMNKDGLIVTNTCWRRRWQRPLEDSDIESNSTSAPTPLTEPSLSTWCLPREESIQSGDLMNENDRFFNRPLIPLNFRG